MTWLSPCCIQFILRKISHGRSRMKLWFCGQRFLQVQQRAQTVSQWDLFKWTPHNPSKSAWKILIQDFPSLPSTPQKARVTYHLCQTPRLKLPYLVLLVQGNHQKWIHLSCAVPKKDPARTQEWAQGLTPRLNSSFYVKVNGKTLPLIPTSSRQEKIGVLFKDSTDTPVIKGCRGDPSPFSFLREK